MCQNSATEISNELSQCTQPSIWYALNTETDCQVIENVFLIFLPWNAYCPLVSFEIKQIGNALFTIRPNCTEPLRISTCRKLISSIYRHSMRHPYCFFTSPQDTVCMLRVAIVCTNTTHDTIVLLQNVYMRILCKKWPSEL